MKLRHPGLIKLAGLAIAGAVRGLMGTVRCREYLHTPTLRPDHPDNTQRYIYAFWHETILYLAGRYGHHRNVAILISQHADGELIAQVVHRLGMKTVRGSTNKNGVSALMKMLEEAHRGHLAITPDGPRGPRREVQAGTIFLASRTGFPIIPIGISYHRAWHARSWDRFGVPHPFSYAAGVAGELLHVPPHLPREQLGQYAQELKQRMDVATEAAQRWTTQRSW